MPELRVELVLCDVNSKRYFAQLEAEKEVIEQALGQPASWVNPPEQRTSRIYLQTSADLNDRGKWPEQHAWLLEHLEIFHRTFADRVKRLK